MGKTARTRKDRRETAPAAPTSTTARGRVPDALLLGAAAILVAVLAVFAQTRSFPFVNFDDPQYVVRNPHVQKGLTAESVAWAFSAFHEANWHPLTWISHMLDVELHGMNAGGHHTSAIAIHALASLLLFAAFHLMTGRPLRSLVVALLFAVHPLHVESVAWIAERKDVLSGFFWCAGLAAYAFYVRRRSAARYALVFLCFAAGLMAKPMMITFPFALLLLDLWPLARVRRDTIRSLLAEKIPLFALVPVSAALTILAQSRGGAVRTLEEIPLLDRLGNAVVGYAVYLRKAFWPAPLSPFYPWQAPAVAGVVAAGALLVAITVFAFRARNRFPFILPGWFWFLGTLAPVIGVIQVGKQALADRYTYLPFIGLFAAVVWLLAELAERARVPVALRGALTAAWILMLMAVASRYVPTWKSSIAFWSRAVEVAGTPTTDMHLSLALAYAEAGRIGEALPEHQKAVESDPRSFTARMGYAAALKAAGDFAGAIRELQAAAAIDPAVADVHNNLGTSYEKTGDDERALAAYREALRLDPDLVEAHMNLATLLSRRGDARGAIDHYGRALALQPSSTEARVYLALALWNGGERQRAVAELERAATRDPAAANAVVTKALRLPPGDPGNLNRLLQELRGRIGT